MQRTASRKQGCRRTAANVVIAVSNATAAATEHTPAAASCAAAAGQQGDPASTAAKGALVAGASRYRATDAKQVQLTPSVHQVPCAAKDVDTQQAGR